MAISLFKKIVGLLFFTVMSGSVYSQDLIAKQAPIDVNRHKMKVKVVKVNLDNPADNIYTDWTDNLRSCMGEIPSDYKVNLKGFCMPTTSRKINSVYGPRWGKQHEGIDIKVYIGDTIRAAFDGKVRICKYNGNGYGYYIVIRHPNGLETLYGHLSKQLVKKDQIVHAGDVIGLGGNTGKSTGSHLHFETRILGVPINPALMFDFEHQDVIGDYYIVDKKIVKK